jgi:alanine racemase
MHSAPDDASEIFRPTIAEIDIAAFEGNLGSVLSMLPEGSSLIAVVKADAYGHGSVEIARVCESAGVSMVAVALLEEAVHLRRNGISVPILLFGAVDERAVSAAVEHGVIPGIPSPESLRAIDSWSRSSSRNVAIHLKIDSGMNRMGLIERDLAEAIEILSGNSRIQLQGIYSHYANSSDPDDVYNVDQETRFSHLLQILRSHGITAPTHHFANSAALVGGRVLEGDYVRAGLSLFGGEPLDAGQSRLRPVMAWKTRIERLKSIEPGEIVGYGRTWRAKERSTIATLPVGYADGYSRRFSNNGEVLVRGRRVPVVGRVSMDLVTIDVTAVAEAEVGDEVVLLGTQGEQTIRAEDLARLIGTIPYEIFTSVSGRVPRRYVHNHRVHTEPAS